MTVVAWAYMVETEEGLSKKQVNNLLELAPSDIQVIPFNVDDGTSKLESNSIALGFIDNEHFDELEKVKNTLAVVCNDWDNERDDKTYLIEGEDNEDLNALKVIMLCDDETVK